MSEGPAYEILPSTGIREEAEQLRAELQLSIDQLRYLEVPDSQRLLSEVQTLIDQIAFELSDISGH